MSQAIRREDSAIILKKIDECRLNLKKENVYSCLLFFKAALQMTLKTKMLPGDEREIMKAINAFQRDLSSSPAFVAFYGPVSFHDDAVKTSLDFIEQLIQIHEEDLRQKVDPLENRSVGEAPGEDGAGAPESPDKDRPREERIKQAGMLLDRGEYGMAKQLLGDDEESTAMLLQIVNNLGIQYRKAGKYDQAVAEFRKALVLYPDDEGLYYNIARAWIEKRDWAAAEAAIQQGLAVNPDFQEGKTLLNYIRSHLRY